MVVVYTFAIVDDTSDSTFMTFHEIIELVLHSAFPQNEILIELTKRPYAARIVFIKVTTDGKFLSSNGEAAFDTEGVIPFVYNNLNCINIKELMSALEESLTFVADATEY